MEKQKITVNNLPQIQSMVNSLLQKISGIKQFQYKDLLRQKFIQFAQDFNKKSQEFEVQHLKDSFRLILKFKCDPPVQKQQKNQNQETKKKVKLSDPNIFIYSFQLPCTYQSYEKIIRSSEIQTKVDQIIDKYNVLKFIGSSEDVQVQLVNLCYKRVLIIAPREFIYIRIFFKDQFLTKEEIQTNWIITFSVPYEIKSDKTRAQIIFTAQRIQQNLKLNTIRVEVYSEVDMKSAVKPDMARSKGFSQIKKYIQKIYDYSKSL